MSMWKIGENVPWSVSWTGEQSFDLQPSEDFPGRFDLVQVQRPGEGVPRFAAVHVTRQRIGMQRQWCHVCGRPTLTRDRYLFPVESGGFVTLGDDTMRYAGTVPPVHLACARRARLMCPHLSHARADPIPFPSEDSLILPRPDIPEGMAELAKTLPRGANVVFSCFRLYGPRFSRQVERLRKARGGEPAERWRQFTA